MIVSWIYSGFLLATHLDNPWLRRAFQPRELVRKESVTNWQWGGNSWPWERKELPWGTNVWSWCKNAWPWRTKKTRNPENVRAGKESLSYRLFPWKAAMWLTLVDHWPNCQIHPKEICSEFHKLGRKLQFAPLKRNEIKSELVDFLFWLWKGSTQVE